jgi:pimeloyl-ACP methyl ester carboxylesterase
MLALAQFAKEDVQKRFPGAPLPPMFIGGHSLGGLIAAMACQRDQSRWSGLLLSSPALDVEMGPVLRWVGVRWVVGWRAHLQVSGHIWRAACVVVQQASSITYALVCSSCLKVWLMQCHRQPGPGSNPARPAAPLPACLPCCFAARLPAGSRQPWAACWQLWCPRRASCRLWTQWI